MSKIVNKYNQLEKDRFEEIRKTDYRFREFGLDDEEFGIESQGRRSR